MRGEAITSLAMFIKKNNSLYCRERVSEIQKMENPLTHWTRDRRWSFSMTESLPSGPPGMSVRIPQSIRRLSFESRTHNHARITVVRPLTEETSVLLDGSYAKAHEARSPSRSTTVELGDISRENIEVLPYRPNQSPGSHVRGARKRNKKRNPNQ